MAMMSNEKENTFRMLKDEPLLESRPWRCMFGLHKWLRWGDPKRSPSSIYVRQNRYCAACNYFQERKFTE